MGVRLNLALCTTRLWFSHGARLTQVPYSICCNVPGDTIQKYLVPFRTRPTSCTVQWLQTLRNSCGVCPQCFAKPRGRCERDLASVLEAICINRQDGLEATCPPPSHPEGSGDLQPDHSRPPRHCYQYASLYHLHFQSFTFLSISVVSGATPNKGLRTRAV